MTKITDIEKIVILVKTFSGKIEEERLLSELKNRPLLYHGIGNYEKHIWFCERLGLIEKTAGYFQLTQSGENFFKLIPDSNGQKKIGEKMEVEVKFLQKIMYEKKSMFAKDFGDSTLDETYHDGDVKWSFEKNEIQKIEENLLNFLDDIGFLHEQNNSYQVVESGTGIIPKIRKGKLTESEFLKQWIQKQKTGRIAEELTVEKERERIDKNIPGLGLSVKRVSDDKNKGISEGYDVISFSGDNLTLKWTDGKPVHDKFIEVKGTSGSKPIFFWSENERDTAKELGEEYWLYVWINVKEKMSNSTMPKGFGNPNPKREGDLFVQIQNPYDKVWLNQDIERTEKITYRFDLENYEDK